MCHSSLLVLDIKTTQNEVCSHPGMILTRNSKLYLLLYVHARTKYQAGHGATHQGLLFLTVSGGWIDQKHKNLLAVLSMDVPNRSDCARSDANLLQSLELLIWGIPWFITASTYRYTSDQLGIDFNYHDWRGVAHCLARFSST